MNLLRYLLVLALAAAVLPACDEDDKNDIVDAVTPDRASEVTGTYTGFATKFSLSIPDETEVKVERINNTEIRIVPQIDSLKAFNAIITRQGDSLYNGVAVSIQDSSKAAINFRYRNDTLRLSYLLQNPSEGFEGKRTGN